MLLVCDIGNTRVHLGLYQGETLIRKLSFSGQKVIDYEARWNELFEGLDPNAAPTDTVVCSVNPKAKIPFTHYVNQRVGVRPLVVGDTVPYPIPVLLDDPAEVGPDRVVNGYAAFALLGGGPLVVCDFGTAITLDVIDEEGAYVGGVIAPGIQTSARALANQTALLPYVDVEPVQHAIGRNTIDAMKGGLYYGTIGMVKAMCERVNEELAGRATFIATGGDAAMVAKELPLVGRVHPDLTLEGLRLIHERVRAHPC